MLLSLFSTLMPPPDTTYIPGQTGTLLPDSLSAMDSAALIQYLQRFYDSVHYRNALEAQSDGPKLPFSEGAMFLIVIGFIGLVLLVSSLLSSRVRNMYEKEQEDEVDEQIIMKKAQYDEWFTANNPYYRSLPLELKERFLRRTLRFMNEKEFRFHKLEEDEFIKAMISGAAVQTTLGLKNYLMDYYPVIHVIKSEYVLEWDKETYYGHVSRTGVYISWSHFMSGYADYTDSVNVGLHEWAHAVSFDVFLGEMDNHDFAFRRRLEDFMEEGKPVFRAMREGSNRFLDDYAATNFDEFWAVCVETFFEEPEEFSRVMPDLYHSIVDLLNQDPLNHSKIINRQLAGYET